MRNLADTSHQLSLCEKTCPHCRELSVDTQSNWGGSRAVELSQRREGTLDQSIFMSLEMIWFHIMSILQPEMPLICMIASQNVTFLFRRSSNVWRTIVWCFFVRCFVSLPTVASHYIISNRTANDCLSPHIAVSGQCAILYAETGVGILCGWQWDDFIFNYLVVLTCSKPQ